MQRVCPRKLKPREGLSDKQYGFRRGRSTVDAIAEVVSSAKRSVGRNQKQKGYCAAITIDIKNPFNTARWGIIMEAMRGKKIPGYLLDIIDSYLSDKTLIYETDLGRRVHRITVGIPQGSVLGSLLWNIMYDVLLELELLEGAKIVGFADDAAIVATAGTGGKIVANYCLRHTQRWLESVGLEMASQKTKEILITERRVFAKPSLQLGIIHIPWSKNIRYLGVQLDDRLSFATHLIMTAEKAARCAASLARLMPNIGGPSDAKRRLLTNAVCAKFAAPIWADAVNMKVLTQKLGAVLRNSTMRITSAYKTISDCAILVLAGVPPVDLLA